MSTFTHARGTAAAAGIAYLVTIVASIPAPLALYTPILADPGYITGDGSDARVQWGGVLEYVTALACIATAVILFPVLRRFHCAAALGFVTARVLEAALITLSIVAMLSVVSLRHDSEGLGAAARMASAQALIAVHDWAVLLGPGVIPGLNALLLGFLMYRSGLVPRIIPLIGLLGAPPFLVAAVASLVGITDPSSLWSALATLPIFVWEFSLGLCLTFRGFRTPSIAVPAPVRN